MRRLPPWGRLRNAAERGLQGFLAAEGTQFAAAIAFRVLFSLFPLAILLVAGAGLVLRADDARAKLIDFVLDRVPLTEQGARELESLLQQAAAGSALTLVGAAGLVWAASGMMASLRAALNQAWPGAEPRPFLRGKLVDVLLLLGVGLLVAISVALTLALRLAERVADLIGPLGPVASVAVWLSGLALPLALSFATALVVYHLVPAARPPLRDVGVGAFLAAVGFELAKHALALYFEHFARYNVVYGSLGAVVAFLFFVYVVSILFLLGAHVAAQWPQAEPEQPPEELPGLSRSLGQRLLGALRGLALRR